MPGYMGRIIVHNHLSIHFHPTRNSQRENKIRLKMHMKYSSNNRSSSKVSECAL